MILSDTMPPGADLPQLHGRHGYEWNRPLYAHPDEERRGSRDDAAGQPRPLALPVDQTQQPLPYPLLHPMQFL